MSSRREFIKTSGLAVAALSIPKLYIPSSLSQNKIDSKKADLTNHRPERSERKFISQAIEEKIKEIKNFISDKELAVIFENCYPNTLDTTVNFQILNGKPDTFVITGDINAMWLRDSSSQVYPYLQFANKDYKLKNLLAGVINRHTKCILIDPYANAFNYGPTGSEFDNDLTDMKPDLHERKWEVDSLCYPVRLAYGFWKTTGDVSCFDGDWKSAMKLIIKTFKEQQRKHGEGPYKFQRITAWQSDTVAGGGYGNPVSPVGLICSIFRPSDDATIFPFLIPSNYFAVTSLRQLAEMFSKMFKDDDFSRQCLDLASEVETALYEYAPSNHLSFGKILSYEVDGFGNQLFMDDANVPSLLGLPYLNCLSSSDILYQNTRKFLLNDLNPYFFKSNGGEGIGSAHTGINKIWPISLIIQALTSSNDDEILKCLKTLVNSSAGTGFMHESFDKDDPAKFSRKWFAWANTLFGELIIKLYDENPYLLKA
ncbi:MAG: glycoside hydrolase family 125 protein [Ignavibacteriaceae bacterium]